ncbi:MAG: hypothetical protein FWC83_00220 [Alphaproteobacteria bacterium]|nr:hypothetical protein [Alphaproteobacteria bacterium]
MKLFKNKLVREWIIPVIIIPVVLGVFTATRIQIRAQVSDFCALRHEIYTEMTRDGAPKDPVIAEGTMGDLLVRLPQTERLKRIASAAPSARFVSINNPEQYIIPGYCLLNAIPFPTISDNNVRCLYRLFCGNASDMHGYYAVELCGDTMTCRH